MHCVQLDIFFFFFFFFFKKKKTNIKIIKKNLLYDSIHLKYFHQIR
jgi:hypothetical protein